VPLAAGVAYSFHFDPVTDQIRVVGSNGQNFRVNPDNGLVVAIDAPLRLINGITPQVAAIAYDRNVPGATATTLFGLDGTQNLLYRIGSVDGTPLAANSGQTTILG